MWLKVSSLKYLNLRELENEPDPESESKRKRIPKELVDLIMDFAFERRALSYLRARDAVIEIREKHILIKLRTVIAGNTIYTTNIVDIKNCFTGFRVLTLCLGPTLTAMTYWKQEETEWVDTFYSQTLLGYEEGWRLGPETDGYGFLVPRHNLEGNAFLGPNELPVEFLDVLR